MADLYIVTVEDEQDGMFWDDPDGYYSLTDAQVAARKKRPPEGYVAAIYSCTLIETLTPLSHESKGGE